MRRSKIGILTLCLSFASLSYSHPFLPVWETLSKTEQEQLLPQIEHLDLRAIESQRSLIAQKEIPSGTLTPFLDYAKTGSSENRALGKKLIAEGKAGCLFVAGGQGSRLNYTGPKGVFPVTLVKQKSLFRLFAEKILAAGKEAGRPLLAAIMTSPGNHEETVAYFENNHFFGLDTDQVFFFSQKEIPLLDPNGNLFLESAAKISTGPDGNAASLNQFVKQGIWSLWYEKGVRYLNYLNIDNALGDPFDAELIGFHASEQPDVVIKCISREDPLEKVGIILKKDDAIHVIEYSEISPEERDAKGPDGVLKHLCANISAFSFKMEFVHDIAVKHYDEIPFHKAWKAVKYLTPEGETKMATKPMSWKFEKFIFDVLPYAQSVKALLYPREECFAPLKNAIGTDSIVEVQDALQHYDRQIFSRISGSVLPISSTFELDPEFYYPTADLLAKWEGKSLPITPYINP